MKQTTKSIIEALVIQISALGVGKKKVPPSDLIRANQLLKKAGKIIGHRIEAKSETKAKNRTG